MKNSKVLGFGKYTASKVFTNDDLSKIVETNDEWIVQRTGISERRIASAEETTTEMAYKACLQALKNSKVDKSEIDGIIFATFSPDYDAPNSASLLQMKLDMNDQQCFAFELAVGCAGFVYSLEVARSLIATGQMTKCLVVGAETLSRTVDWTDRGTCVLFGDAASACVISASDENKVYNSYINSKGSTAITKVAMPLNNPVTQEEQDSLYVQMNGQEVYLFAVNAIKNAVDKVLEINNLTIDDIDLIVPHQANLRIIDQTTKKLKIDKSKMYVNIHKYGNTSAASIPLAVTEAIEEGRIKAGNKVLLVGFGAGLTWGANIIEL